MRVDGRCHCGALAYSADADPANVSICYCTDCQRLTGSAFRISVTVRAEDFVLSAGRPKTYVKTAESGARRIQAFCGDCGSPIYSAAEKDPTHFTLRVGALAQRDELPPRVQLWMRSKPAWVEPVEGIPSFEKDAPRAG
jgi:hypothetical protein